MNIQEINVNLNNPINNFLKQLCLDVNLASIANITNIEESLVHLRHLRQISNWGNYAQSRLSAFVIGCVL